MKTVVHIQTPADIDAPLARGIDQINKVLLERSERFAERYPEDAPEWMKAEWVGPDPGSGLIMLRLTSSDLGAPIVDRFTADGIRNGVGRGEPDAAHWVFRVWDGFLESQIDKSLRRVRDQMTTVGSN